MSRRYSGTVWSAVLALGIGVGGCDRVRSRLAGKPAGEGDKETAPTPAQAQKPSPAGTNPAPAPSPTGVTPKTHEPEAAKALSQAFSSTAKAVRPSVVRIDVEHSVPRMSRTSRSSADPFFGQLPPGLRHFFDFGDAPGFSEVPVPSPSIGTGSGFVLDTAGNIMTNSHVVEGGTKLRVTFFDGNEAPAKLVGKDGRTDVAVIRLEKVPSNLTVARLGDSTKLEVGEWVLAIGSPLGLDQTVTAGIVSGKGRVGRKVQMSGDRVREYIQTDAKINPGNSGGPLVSLGGEVVGINTLIRVGAGGAYGFAVPISEAYRVAQAILKDGRIRYPFLGVNVRELKPVDELKKLLGATVPEKGALVVEVTPGSPAAKAGMKPGDVIIKLDDKQVEGPDDVVAYVSARQIGDAVAVSVYRAAGNQTFRALLAEAPSEDGQSDRSPQLGLSLQTLTPSLAESLGLPSTFRGVAVTDVAEGSQAEQAGLAAGEVIVEIDHRAVRTVDEAIAILKASRGKHLLRVRGPSGFRFVALGGE